MSKTFTRATIVTLLVIVLITLALPAPAQAQSQVHTVRRGDTLYSIARRYGTSVSAIMSANGLTNRNFIWVGQRLRIPTSGGSSSSGGGSWGGVHVVRRGETLASIARRYGTTVSAMASANGLRNPNFIWVGQRLRIPTASSGGTSTQGGSSGGSGNTSTSGGGIHVVRRGETLAAIARRYGTSISAIARANGLSNPNYIWAGQRLRIPSGGSSSGQPTYTGGGSSAGRWIDVDLSSQRLHAYQGNTVVRSMIVSTGISRYPTPPGRFKIYSKYRSVTMSGPGYYLPGVPHTMFFYRGYAIHGTYWHNNFGTPMSHGCINLTKADAAWLYGWASVGTPVVIHW